VRPRRRHRTDGQQHPAPLKLISGSKDSALDGSIGSSLVLGFVGAGGIGFQLLTAMNVFQYRQVSLLLIVVFIIVFAAERLSAICRERLA
jgi:phosphonate transport system permease protein